MSARKLLTVAAIVFGCGLMYLAFERFVLGSKPENRFVLYDIRRQLQIGMTRAEVATLIEGRSGHRPKIYASADQRYMTLSVAVGLQSDYDLRLEFREGRLVHALLRDADNGSQPTDSVPDL